MTKQSDHWDSGDYQHSAGFVPKLAGKVTEWLDLQKDDVLLDVGCGDGILNLEFGKLLAQGKGSVHGVDKSAAMIKSAQELCKDRPNCTFEVIDGTALASSETLKNKTFTKAFSNAALHWILRDPSTRSQVFQSVHALLVPSGTFTFEMGGLGNVSEMRTALLLSLSRRIGLTKALELDPWFFPDEAWVTKEMEKAGFRVDRVEREWRPTRAAEGGVEGWVRLFGKQMLEGVEEGEEREAVVKEIAEVLSEVCKQPDGGHMISTTTIGMFIRRTSPYKRESISSVHTVSRRDATRSVEPRIYEAFTLLKGWPNEAIATEYLHDLANAVAPILQRHGWQVGALEEFYPEDMNILCSREVSGRVIRLRLRDPQDRFKFNPFGLMVDAMLHELAYIHASPESFEHGIQELLDQLRQEYTGTQGPRGSADFFNLPTPEPKRHGMDDGSPAETFIGTKQKIKLDKGPKDGSGSSSKQASNLVSTLAGGTR
ncbi:WLM domain-containing protein [Sarocladium implicatum]|nr:WLM domain-containing protein [Sarocladium implicatum]